MKYLSQTQPAKATIPNKTNKPNTDVVDDNISQLNTLIDEGFVNLVTSKNILDFIKRANIDMDYVVCHTEAICYKYNSPHMDRFKSLMYNNINNFYIWIKENHINIKDEYPIKNKWRRIIPTCCPVTTIVIEQPIYVKLKQLLGVEMIPSTITASPCFRVHDDGDGQVCAVAGSTSRLGSIQIYTSAFGDDYWFKQRIKHSMDKPDKISTNKDIAAAILERGFEWLKAHEMLRTISHEYLHVKQLATYQSLVVDKNIPWIDRTHEIEAVDFSNKFMNEITIEDLSWAKCAYDNLIQLEKKAIASYRQDHGYIKTIRVK